MSMLTKIASVALISASSLAFTVESASALSISFNTGVINGAEYSISGPINVASGLNTTIPDPAYLANGPDSFWIGPLPTANAASPASNAPSGNYVYSTVFSLAGLDTTTATFTPLRVASDNKFILLTLNGVQLLNLLPIITPPQVSDFDNTAFNTSYNIDLNTFRTALLPTNNTLAFTVNNPVPTFIGTTNPTAFRAEFTVNATPVPFEFERTSSLLLIGGYFATKRFLSKKKS